MEDSMNYCDGMMVAVKSGDTLYSISMKYHVPLAVLLRANPYVDVYNLQVGETICVPVRREEDAPAPCNNRPCWNRETAEEMRKEIREEMQEEMREEMREGASAGRSQGMANEMQRTTEEMRMNSDIEEESQKENLVSEHQTELESKNLENDNNFRWERYVTQPGDTLEMMIADRAAVDDDWEDALEDFVERNGMDKIYLLPGMAFYRQKR